MPAPRRSIRIEELKMIVVFKRALMLTLTSDSTLGTVDSVTGDVLHVGGATGLYPSEMTAPCYEFVKATFNLGLEMGLLQNLMDRSDA